MKYFIAFVARSDTDANEMAIVGALVEGGGTIAFVAVPGLDNAQVHYDAVLQRAREKLMASGEIFAYYVGRSNGYNESVSLSVRVAAVDIAHAKRLALKRIKSRQT